MGTKSQDRALSTLNVAIEALNLAKEVSGIAPAKAVFGSVSALLGMIRIRFLQFCDYQLQVHAFFFFGNHPGSRVFRTLWSIKPITSNSD